MCPVHIIKKGTWFFPVPGKEVLVICPMKKPEKMMKCKKRIKPVILRISTITGPNKVFALEAYKLV